jgi:hypothetical protein
MVPGMASRAEELSPDPEWSEAEWVANLRRVMRTLLVLRDITPEALADGIQIGRSTLYGKLDSGKFSALELVRAARVLGVPASVFYSPAEDLMSVQNLKFLTSVPSPMGQAALFDEGLDPFDFYARPELTSV